MTIIFDGKSFAKKREKELISQVKNLKKRGINPKLATILASDDPASCLYVSLKEKAAKRIGVEMDIYIIGPRRDKNHIIHLIEALNLDPSVHGILVQLPLPSRFKDYKERIISSIAKQKDVDGLREESKFVPATVKAILLILDEALDIVPFTLPLKVAVVGSRGMVGKPLMKMLNAKLQMLNRKVEIIGCNSQTPNLKGQTLQGDIVISATGAPKLIKADMIKEGAIVIDVGSPKGDVDFERIKEGQVLLLLFQVELDQ